MSARNPPADLDAEREVDLRHWLDVVLARRWFVVVGLVIGLVLGGLYSLSGASNYKATVTIQPAQPFSPAGQPVLQLQRQPAREPDDRQLDRLPHLRLAQGAHARERARRARQHREHFDRHGPDHHAWDGATSRSPCSLAQASNT